VIIVDDEQLRALVASMRLDPYCAGDHRFVGVVDANAVLSCVGNDCRKGTGWQSGLLRITNRAIATLYASDHVYGEAYEHLADIARWSKVPVAVLRDRFEANYLPRLRFVTVDTSDVVDPQVLAIPDPDDVPTGQLAKLVAPCVVFSEDRHLRKPGLAPEDWRAVAELRVDLIEAGQAIRSTRHTCRHADSGWGVFGQDSASFSQLLALLEQRVFDNLRRAVPRIVGCPPFGKVDVRLIGGVAVLDRGAQSGRRVIKRAPDVVIEYQRPGPQRVPVAGEVEQLAAEGRAEPGYALVDPEGAPAGAGPACSGLPDDLSQLRSEGIGG